MGCTTSKNFKSKIKQQEKKIDELITINENLQKDLIEMQQNVLNNLMKFNNDTTSDLTKLRTAIDTRFSKLEKTVEKISTITKVSDPNDVYLHVKTPINSRKKSQESGEKEDDDNRNNFTLSLNFDKDLKFNNNLNKDVSQWNKLLAEEENIDNV